MTTCHRHDDTEPDRGRIAAVCRSERRGVQKKPVSGGLLVAGFGLKGDAHAGRWHRQVSLLAEESADKMRAKGLDVGPGDFAENIITKGIELTALPVGTRIKMGAQALVEVTQIGKECHDRCAIYHLAGECVMPTEGIFVRVLRGGEVGPGDCVEVVGPAHTFWILTVSDRAAAGQREDASGPLLSALLEKRGFCRTGYAVVPDDRETIREALRQVVEGGLADLILTTGGTGLSPRDNTPEATADLIEKAAPGLVEAMRAASLKKTPHAMLSRATAGIAGSSLIVNLPGSPRAAQECLEVILPALPHGLDKLRGDPGECGRNGGRQI